MRLLRTILSLLIIPAALAAQSRQTPDSVFTRALSLNNEQRGADARALIDSLMRATQPSSPVYADALFFAGVLAESEQRAEESFRRIVVEFPLHRRAEESLIRLAQLEMTRGNRSQAQRYLDRIIVEHPYGRQRARASYWRARLFFEENEMERGCAELGLARSRVAAADIELKNEIEYSTRRCDNVPAPAVSSTNRAGGSDTGSRARGAAAATKSDSATTSRAGGRAASGGARSTTARGTSTPTATFAVQAAAFPSRNNAQALVDALKSRGYEARIVGTASPYRVWVGSFPTRDAATRLATELKTKNISSGAFVVQAQGRE